MICAVTGLYPGQTLRPLVGRDTELEALSRFFGGRSQSACLVISGDPGMGKTSLWQAGLDLAALEGLRVLSTRASQSEAGLLFAGLADMVENIDHQAFEQVPGPQLHALEVALHRSVPDARAPAPFAISAGFLAAVRALASEVRPLLAVDDAQWLDPASAECLLFLARRVRRGQVLFLISRRPGEPSDLERALEPLGIEVLDIGGMSFGAIRKLIADRLGLTLSGRLLRQLFEASHGNPLLALELGRTIREMGLPAVGGELPLPRAVDEAFGGRVKELPHDVRVALLAVALSGGLSRAALESVADPLAVEDAFGAGLLTLDRDRVRPSHPLLAAAARKASSAAERHDLHRILADTVADPVLRARHRALATVGPDPLVAEEVASAARSVLEQGATHEAEELAGHALRLTPRGDPQEPERLLDLARCHLNALEPAAAAALLDERMDDIPAGRPRLRAYLMRARAAVDPFEYIDKMIAEAGEYDDLRARALSEKVMQLATGHVGRLAEASELARRAVQDGAGTDQESLSRLALAWANIMRGVPVDPAPLGTVQKPPADTLFTSADLFMITVHRPTAIRHAFRGEVRLARDIASHLVDLGDERFSPYSRGALCRQLCEFSLRMGDTFEASRMLDEHEQWNDVPDIRTGSARLHAMLAAVRGFPAEAKRWAAVVMDAAAPPSMGNWNRLETLRAIGIADLFEREHEAAAGHFGTVWEHCRREGVDDPGAFPVAGDLVEALVESRDLRSASEVSAVLGQLSQAQQHPWGMATTRRATATISLAGGDSEVARSDLLGAASEYGHLGLDFERARCLLYLGRLQRRSKKKAGARQNLEAAVELFDRLGCEGWAAQARSELARTGGRPSAEASALTGSEQRVVDLATTGLSNKEIAKRLFVSVHTVEVHLSHAYAKLGVSSRSQLLRRDTRSTS